MKLILGTVQFGLQYGINNTIGKPDEATVNSILDFAYENGIQLLDTAEAYGDAQEVIGNYHARSDKKFKVITKFSKKRQDLSSSLTKRIFQNLDTLNVTSLYGYMFHSFPDYKSNFRLYRNEIKELKNAGVINKFGVSVYTNEEIEELLEDNVVDLVQLPFNLLDNNSQRAEVMKKARQRNVEIHTRSAFLQGLFFRNTNDLPDKLKGLTPYLDAVSNIALRNKLSLGDLSLSYVTQQEDIDYVLIGVDSVEHLKQNIQSQEKRTPVEVLNLIDSINVKDNTLLNPSNWNS